MRIVKHPNLQPAADFVTPEVGVFEIPQGSWGVGTREIAAYVSSCVVLVGHNEVKHIGMVGHFSAISLRSRSDPKLINEQFDTETFNASADALRYLGLPHFTYAWLGGAALHSESNMPGESSVVEDRNYAENRLREVMDGIGMPHANIAIDWNTTQNELYVKLNSQSGLLTIQRLVE